MDTALNKKKVVIVRSHVILVIEWLIKVYNLELFRCHCHCCYFINLKILFIFRFGTFGGDWILILVHFMKYLSLQNSDVGNNTEIKPLITFPGNENGSLLFFIIVSALGSYTIYFSIGGFLHVSSFFSLIFFSFEIISFNKLIVITAIKVVLLCTST